MALDNRSRFCYCWATKDVTGDAPADRGPMPESKPQEAREPKVSLFDFVAIIGLVVNVIIAAFLLVYYFFF